MHASEEFVNRYLGLDGRRPRPDCRIGIGAGDTAWNPDHPEPITGPATLQYIREPDGTTLVLITKE